MSLKILKVDNSFTTQLAFHIMPLLHVSLHHLTSSFAVGKVFLTDLTLNILRLVFCVVIIDVGLKNIFCQKTQKIIFFPLNVFGQVGDAEPSLF